MTRIFSLVFLSCLLIACNKSPDDSSIQTAQPVVSDNPALPLVQPEASGTPVTVPVVVPPADPLTETEIPTQAITFNTNVSFFDVTPAQEEKFQKAVEIIKEVVATEEFKNRILNFTYAGKKTFVNNGGLTNEQIYQKILDASETLQNTVDNEMDLEVQLYYASTSTVGYTYPNVNRIWVNSKFFNSYTAAGVAHNLFHEWLHKLGFTHAYSYSVSRDSSVPYAIGDIVGELGKKFL